METIALIVQPDLSAVFGPLEGGEDRRIREVLAEASAVLDALAAEWSTRAGWKQRGLELDLAPSGQASVSSFVERDQMSFTCDLVPPHYYAESGDDNPDWIAEAAVSIECDHEQDCGTHTIEVLERRETDPLNAANALLAVVRDLVARARSRPLDSWRELDSQSVTRDQPR